MVQENANIYKHEKFNSQCPVKLHKLLSVTNKPPLNTLSELRNPSYLFQSSITLRSDLSIRRLQ